MCGLERQNRERLTKGSTSKELCEKLPQAKALFEGFRNVIKTNKQEMQDV